MEIYDKFSRFVTVESKDVEYMRIQKQIKSGTVKVTISTCGKESLETFVF